MFKGVRNKKSAFCTPSVSGLIHLSIVICVVIYSCNI